MNCPDENSIAQLLQGELAPGDVTELERHLDQCSDCTDLLVQLAQVYAPEPRRAASARTPTTENALADTPSRPSGGELVWAELALAALHLVWVGLAAPILASAAQSGVSLDATGVGASSALKPGATGPIHALATLYVAAWAPLGTLLALFGAWSCWRGKHYGARVCRVHAWLSLPSLVLTPLSIWMLLRLRGSSVQSQPD